MKPNEIRSELVLREITQISIAKKIGICRKCVTEVISGGRKTRRIQEAIAIAIERMPWDVFLDYPNPHKVTKYIKTTSTINQEQKQ